MPPQRTQSDLENGKLKQTLDPKTNFDLSQARRRVGQILILQDNPKIRTAEKKVSASVKCVWALWIQNGHVSRRRRNRLILFWPATQEFFSTMCSVVMENHHLRLLHRCDAASLSHHCRTGIQIAEYAEMRFDFTARKPILRPCKWVSRMKEGLLRLLRCFVH